MGIRRHKVLYDATTEGTGSWIKLDTRYEEDPQRSVHGTIVSGDTIKFQGTTLDAADATELSSIISSDDISDLKTFTSNFNDTLFGNWTFIRVIKTGSTGSSKVQGYI